MLFICVVFIFTNVVFTDAYLEDQMEPAPLVTLNDGYKMPMMALGTWLGNTSTGRVLPAGQEVEQAVLWALEAGYRHIDTAWSYNVEDQVGRAVKAAVKEYEEKNLITTTPAICNTECYLESLKRKIARSGSMVPAVPKEELFITTKLWNDAHARSAVVPALRASLKKLKMSYVHLYLMHWPIGQFANQSYDHTHYLDTWRGMMEAQRLNLTRSIGVSNFNKAMLENIRLHNLTTPAVLQIEFNLNQQQPELLAYCQLHNISVMGYTPFGVVLKTSPPVGAPPPRFNDTVLTKMADKYGKSVPQILLRFAVDMGVTPIPKSLNGTRIFENFDIFDFSLDEADKTTLRSFHTGYRTVPQLKWRDHPFYPFEDIPNSITTTTTTTTTRTTTELFINKKVDGRPKINFRDIKGR